MKIGNPNQTMPHANHIVNRITGDPQLLQALASALTPILFSAETMRALVDAIEAVGNTQAKATPGRLYAANVSALVLNGSSVATRAMVKLNGATTPVVAYVPPHIRAAIATTQDVWVEAVNGNMSDLKIDAVRNIP